MAEYFLDAQIEADEAALADNAVNRLVEEWDGWAPNEGDLEVILIEALAQMASNAANVASVMPAAAFEQMMVLFGVQRDVGHPAATTVTFTLVAGTLLPQPIPSGTEIDIDGWAFLTDDDVVASTLTLAGVAVSADEISTDANGLVGDRVAMITALAFVQSVSVDAPTAGAVDPETDDSYLNKGSRALELQALTLVTTRDYELLALTDPRVARVVAQSNMATRTITVTASGPDAAVLSAPVKTDLLNLFNSYRQTTWVVQMGDATLTTIGVSFQVHVYPDFVASSVVADCVAALTDFLDPMTWNNSGETSQAPATTWLVEPRVRKNKLIDQLGDVNGVDYVVDLTITGSAGAVQSNGDWLMPGTVPLPVAGVITGTAV